MTIKQEQIVSGTDASKDILPAKLIIRSFANKHAFALMRLLGVTVDSPGALAVFHMFAARVAYLEQNFADDKTTWTDEMIKLRDQVKKTKNMHVTLVKAIDKVS